MHADVGDMLIVEGNQTRAGVIIRILGKDGGPPYVIKWLTDGHISMATPSPYSKIVRTTDRHRSAQPPGKP